MDEFSKEGKITTPLLKKSLYICQAAILILILAVWWRRNQSGQDTTQWRNFQTTVFNTTCTLRLRGTPVAVSAAGREIIAKLFQLHNCLNRFDGHSPVAQFNELPANTPFVCPPLLWEALQKAREAHRVTDGAFDITILPVLNYWKAHPNDGDTSSLEFQDAMAKSGFGRLAFDDSARTVTKRQVGMMIDFGGMAKGLALDMVSDILKEYRITSFLIDLGGNLYLSQDLPEAAIAHPIDSRKELCTITQAGGRFIATSSNSERAITPGKIGHIITPASGLPIQRSLSATAITPTGVESDVFSTAVFIGGEPLAKRLSAERSRCGFVICRQMTTDKTETVLVGNVSIK